MKVFSESIKVFVAFSLVILSLTGCGSDSKISSSEAKDVVGGVYSGKRTEGVAYMSFNASTNSVSRGWCTEGKPNTKEFCIRDLVSVNADQAQVKTKEFAKESLAELFKTTENTSVSELDETIAAELALLARHKSVVATDSAAAASNSIVAAQVRESEAEIKRLQTYLAENRKLRASLVSKYGDFNDEFQKFWNALLKSPQRYDLTVSDLYVEKQNINKFQVSRLIASALGRAIIELVKGQTMAIADSVSFPTAMQNGYIEFYLGNVQESNLSNGDYSDWDHPEDYQKNIRYGTRVVIFQNGQVLKRIQDAKFGQLICISMNLLPSAKNSLVQDYDFEKMLYTRAKEYTYGFDERKKVQLNCGLLQRYKMPGEKFPNGLYNEKQYIVESSVWLDHYYKPITVGELRQTLGNAVSALRFVHY